MRAAGSPITGIRLHPGIMSARRRTTGTRRRVSPLSKVGRAIAGVAAGALLFVGYLALTVPDVRPLADTAPEHTAFMRLRTAEAHAEGRPARRDYRFVPYSRIGQPLKRAVLVAEDSGFWQHEGIEIEAIRDSFEAILAKGRIVRGGSTITQQLAKNLYLWPSQDPLRKLRELMITHRLERLLSKRRILELYLNVVEWGHGTWGAEAAARHYFRKPAAGITSREAALLAGALINPNVYDPADPPARLRRRQQIILQRMGRRQAPQPPLDRDTVGAERSGHASSPLDTAGAPSPSEEVPPEPPPEAAPADDTGPPRDGESHAPVP